MLLWLWMELKAHDHNRAATNIVQPYKRARRIGGWWGNAKSTCRQMTFMSSQTCGVAWMRTALSCHFGSRLSTSPNRPPSTALSGAWHRMLLWLWMELKAHDHNRAATNIVQPYKRARRIGGWWGNAKSTCPVLQRNQFELVLQNLEKLFMIHQNIHPTQASFCEVLFLGITFAPTDCELKPF